jgi:hypothetical protein
MVSWSVAIVLTVLLAVEHYFHKIALSEMRRSYDKERAVLIENISRLSLAKSLPEYDAASSDEPCHTWGPEDGYPAEDDGPEVALHPTVWE